MRLARWARHHQLAVDVIIAVCFVVIDTAATLGGGSWWPAHPGKLAWAMLGLQALADLSLVARRRAPILVIAIFIAFTLAISFLVNPAGALTPESQGTVWAPYGTVVAAYGPFYYRKNRTVAFAAVGTLTMVVARVWEPSATVITVAVLRTALGPLLALYVSARGNLIRALRERAERAERESEMLAEQARAQERARLAAEMHDVVTHRVSLMVLQAGALGVTASDDATRKAAEELRAAGCQALDELRDLVGILQTVPDGDQAPTTADFATLIAESTAVGVQAELIEDGDPALASPVVARTAYRVVREALTNVRKHAPGARVIVRVSYADTQVRLSIRNTRPDGELASPLAGTGSGVGLSSLRQRVELVHGSMHAGYLPDGGFEVAVTLPSFVPTTELAV